MAERLMTLPVQHVRPNPDQPRKHFDEEAIRALAKSIDEDGQAVRAIVRECIGERDHYELIAGERRWRAISTYCTQVRTIDVVVVDVDCAEALRLSFVENENRVDLSPLERARAMHRLIAGGATQMDVARMVGKSDYWVSSCLSLLKLDPEVQALMSPELPERKQLSFTAATYIARAPREDHAELAAFAMRDDVRLADVEERVGRQYGRARPRGRTASQQANVPWKARRTIAQAARCIENQLDSPERVKRSLVSGAHLSVDELREFRAELQAARRAFNVFAKSLDEVIEWARSKQSAA